MQLLLRVFLQLEDRLSSGCINVQRKHGDYITKSMIIVSFCNMSQGCIPKSMVIILITTRRSKALSSNESQFLLNYKAQKMQSFNLLA